MDVTVANCIRCNIAACITGKPAGSTNKLLRKELSTCPQAFSTWFVTACTIPVAIVVNAQYLLHNIKSNKHSIILIKHCCMAQ